MMMVVNNPHSQSQAYFTLPNWLLGFASQLDGWLNGCLIRLMVCFICHYHYS